MAFYERIRHLGHQRQVAAAQSLEREQEVNRREYMLRAARTYEQNQAYGDLLERYRTDPRVNELHRMLSPEQNPELFEGLQAVWNSWRVYAKNRRGLMDDVHFDPEISTPRLITQWELPHWKRLDEPYEVDVQPYVDRFVQTGGHISFGIEWMSDWRGDPIQAFKLTGRDEHLLDKKRRKYPKDRIGIRRDFDLHIKYGRHDDLQMTLFPQAGIISEQPRRVFHTQDELLNRIGLSLLDEKGRAGTVPVLGRTTFYPVVSR